MKVIQMLLLKKQNRSPKKLTRAIYEEQLRYERKELLMHVTSWMSGMLIQLCKTRIGHAYYEILAHHSTHQNFTLEC